MPLEGSRGDLGGFVKNGRRTVEARNGISASAITVEGEARARARGHTRVILFPVQAFSKPSEGIQDPAGREIAAENPLQYFYRVQAGGKKGEREGHKRVGY